jgi:hypothetical protein
MTPCEAAAPLQSGAYPLLLLGGGKVTAFESSESASSDPAASNEAMNMDGFNVCLPSSARRALPAAFPANGAGRSMTLFPRSQNP